MFHVVQVKGLQWSVISPGRGRLELCWKSLVWKLVRFSVYPLKRTWSFSLPLFFLCQHSSSSLFKKTYLYLFLWLRWVLVAACGLPIFVMKWELLKLRYMESSALSRIQLGSPCIGSAESNHWISRKSQDSSPLNASVCQAALCLGHWCLSWLDCSHFSRKLRLKTFMWLA